MGYRGMTVGATPLLPYHMDAPSFTLERSAAGGGETWLSPPFPASCPCRVALGPSPAPAASNPACWFPAPGFPARFASWVMGPIDWACFQTRLQCLTL